MSLRADAEWGRRAYGLTTTIKGGVLRLLGTVSFKAHYNGDLLIYGNCIPVIIRPEIIVEDSWPIVLLHNYQNSPSIPRVFDASDRLAKTQFKRKISSLDMHLNTNPKGSFCVAPKSELEQAFSNGFDLESYFNNYLIPFLFQQSYFEKHGSWPWWNYPHGEFGEYLWRLEQALRQQLSST